MSADEDSQRALRIRWVGQNLDDHTEDLSIALPSISQGTACIRDAGDASETNRLPDARNPGDQPKVSSGIRHPSTSTLLSDSRSRFVRLFLLSAWLI